MASKAISLVSNGAVVAPSPTSGLPWTGGKTSLVVMATTYPTTCRLELLGKDGATWIAIQTVTANGITALDLPAGTYRFYMNGGTALGVYADLVSIPY